MYVSPPGSKAYLDKTDLFELENIQLCYHSYEHPTYRQQYGKFLPYMSILDLIFNVGVSSLQTLRSVPE